MTRAALAGPGVLSRDEIAATTDGILAIQRPDGAIPWFHGDKLDPWDHVESAMALDAAEEHAAARRAYRWLAGRQNPDGSWFAGYADGPAGAGPATDQTKDANFSAYIAVGAYHHFLSTGDRGTAEELWPCVERAITFVLGLQRPDGAIRWNTRTEEALLTGSSSVFQAVRCAMALARLLGRDTPDWEWAAAALGTAVAAHPERFTPKDRYSMDWYYPVLSTALRGAAADERIDASWDRFVVPGLGVHCVDDHPWVTGGETCELALTLAVIGRKAEAKALLTDIQHLRNPADGLYWTGYVYADTAIWPEELTSWTAGSLLLALAALGGDHATEAVFGGAGLPVIRPAAVNA